MYCPKCGTHNQDSSTFCQGCGSKLPSPVQNVPPSNNGRPMYNGQQVYNQQPVYQQPVYQQPVTYQQPVAYQQPAVYQQPVYNQGYGFTVFRNGEQLSSNKVLDAIKRLCLSPLFLVSVICYTIVTLINIFSATSTATEIVNSLFYSALYYISSDLAVMIDLLIIGVVVIVAIPGIVMTTGMWVIFGSALNRNNDSMSTAGFTTIRVMNTIYYVLAIIGTILYGIVSFMMFASVSNYGAQLSPASFIVVLIVLGILVFCCYCFYKINELIDYIRYCIQNKYPAIPSLFVPIYCFITSGFSLLALLTQPLLNSITYSMSPMASFSSVIFGIFGCIPAICFGILVIQFKGKMEVIRAREKESES